MDRETKIKLAQRAALISGIFCALVALLLILNFWHMKQHEPLESQTIEALVKRLAQEPNNEVLKEEIRSFDLLARKAYFTSQWQVKTGTWLLLFGGIILAVSMKVYTDLRAGIEPPEEMTESLLKARANTQYWLFLSGGLILGLSLVAAILTNDYLSSYDRMAENSSNDKQISDVEVIEVFPGDGPAAGQVNELQGDADSSGVAMSAESVDRSAEGTAATAKDQNQGPAVAASRIAFDRNALRQNHATFRGFMGQGISYRKNIPESWDGPSGQNIKWKVAFSKPGYSRCVPVLSLRRHGPDRWLCSGERQYETGPECGSPGTPFWQ